MDTINKTLEISLKLEFEVILITQHREEAEEERYKTKAAPHSVEQPDTFLVGSSTGLKIEIEELCSPASYWLGKSDILGGETQELQHNKAGHEDHIGICQEVLTTHISPQVQD